MKKFSRWASVPLALGIALGLLIWSSPVLSARASATESPSLVSACGVAPSAQLRVLSKVEPCVIVVAVGHSFRLSLSANFRWSALHASSSALSESEIAGPASGGLGALVSAHRTGRVTLVATGVMVCATGVACSALARLWSIVVLVGAQPSSPVTLELNLADNARQYSLRPGDHLSIDLLGPRLYVWGRVISSRPNVLRVTSSSAGSNAHASLVARSPGRSTVSAVDNPRCYPQCLAPSRVFRVQVLVSS